MPKKDRPAMSWESAIMRPRIPSSSFESFDVLQAGSYAGRVRTNLRLRDDKTIIFPVGTARHLGGVTLPI